MEQSKMLDPLTYTISRDNGKFYSDRFELNINLPTDIYSAYVPLGAYDISNKLNGNIKNAIIIFIKGNNDNYSPLPSRTQGIFNLEIKTDILIANADNNRFDANKDYCLVIIFHDANADSNSMSTDAARHYQNVISYYGIVDEDNPYSDNYKDNDNKGKDIVQPRKLGMSLIKRG